MEPLIMPDGTEIPATGRQSEVAGVSIVAVKDGKFMAFRDYHDLAPVTRQLGVDRLGGQPVEANLSQPGDQVDPDRHLVVGDGHVADPATPLPSAFTPRSIAPTDRPSSARW
jgi:hypothetical protein